MSSEDGQLFVKNLAYFVRTHEKALANALQLKRQPTKNGQSYTSSKDVSPSSNYNTTSTLAAALSLGSLNFTSQSLKPAKLTLTPHHLFYLLSRFEELGIAVGPMNVRLENIHTEASPANYVSFLNQAQRSKTRSDRDSIHSVSSVRSVMSGMSSLWSSFGLGTSNSVAKSEKAKAALEADLKYLYSAFTKIPCLRLSPDHRARLIAGYEEFPFDTAVPITAFKNVSALEVIDVDFRNFYGWDRLAEQLRTLTVKRANVEDPTDLLVGIVLDDMDKRRRRSSKIQSSAPLPWTSSTHSLNRAEVSRSNSAPGSPHASIKIEHASSPQSVAMVRGGSEDSRLQARPRTGSRSPTRPSSSRQGSSYRFVRVSKTTRSGSGSSNSSTHSIEHHRPGSSSNLLTMGFLPSTKWRFLRHLSLADNSLTSISASGLCPLTNTLHSLDLSTNLFTDIPDSLATLSALKALNLSSCMIDSLHSLVRNPLPAITALNLRANRLQSIAGVERLLSLERLDLRENRMTDPTELARLTGIPNIREIWVANNPFVKTHPSYRTIIFNLFRKTPGYTEDIIIDGTGPGYSERRQLVERVAEPEGVPVMKPPVPKKDTGLVSRPAQKSKAVEEISAKGPSSAQQVFEEGGVPVGSQRRRKGARRRIVEIAHEETQHIPSPTLPSIADASPEIRSRTASEHKSPPPKLEPAFSEIDCAQDTPTIGQMDLKSPPPMLARAESDSVKDIRRTTGQTMDLDFNGDLYRKKLEAIKQEAGKGWLNVLNEDEWNERNRGEYNNPPLMASHPIASRAHSQGIISGGRTLG
ncbi:MAG: hypothetical protein M1834_002754 [Cirrosporium novae-zelandiae]|nr:MAG: hypothetical protein M1834_002754 [Cirrosporium novae-zelandiae]